VKHASLGLYRSRQFYLSWLFSTLPNKFDYQRNKRPTKCNGKQSQCVIRWRYRSAGPIASHPVSPKSFAPAAPALHWNAESSVRAWIHAGRSSKSRGHDSSAPEHVAATSPVVPSQASKVPAHKPWKLEAHPINIEERTSKQVYIFPTCNPVSECMYVFIHTCMHPCMYACMHVCVIVC
jgi:hypothetical protein